MDNKEHTMDELHDAACVYAMALVDYHAKRLAYALDGDARAFDMAKCAMYQAQENLNSMALEIAQ